MALRAEGEGALSQYLEEGATASHHHQPPHKRRTKYFENPDLSVGSISLKLNI